MKALIAESYGPPEILRMAEIEKPAPEADEDDRTFVAAFQSIDRAIINPVFMVTFFGALALTAVAALLHLTSDQRPMLPWIGAALVLYLSVFVITIGVNVPRNNEIKAAGDLDRMIDLRGARERFDEARWVRWNYVRTFASTVAFGLLARALVESGRTFWSSTS